MRSVVIWGALSFSLILPLALASFSPLLQWRDPIYIAAGFAGIIALGLLLLQPLLMSGRLPGISPLRARLMHRLTGIALLVAVVVHIAGLWITSPPDVIDVLTFTSPTPFSLWGVAAMWALIFTATLVALKRRLRLRPKTWRRAHGAFAVVIAVGTVGHAVLIEGTMEVWSKWVLCLLVLAATVKVLWDTLRKA